MKQEKYILDNSFLSSNLVQRLYGNVESIANISSSEISRQLSILSDLESLLYKAKLIVIEETTTEIGAHINILNNQLNWYAEQLLKGSNSFRVRGEKEHRIRKKRGRERVYIESEDSECLRKISEYADAMYSFNRRASRLDVREEFDEIQSVQYNRFLHLARIHSEDLDAVSLSFKEKSKFPKYTGYKLETDKKIVATAFTLAYQLPIIILTDDKGIRTLVERVGENISDENQEETKTLEKPRYSISTLRPAYSQMQKKIVYPGFLPVSNELMPAKNQ